jgi:hypothetical protein
MNITNQYYHKNNKNIELSEDESEDESEDNIKNDKEDNSYVFKAKICPRLSRELNMEEIKFDDMGSYEPPKQHGLSNSDIIIPQYYKLHEKKFFLDLDYFNIIKDDIRNYRSLNDYQIEYLRNISEDQKIELFKIFNSVLKNMNEILTLYLE